MSEEQPEKTKPVGESAEDSTAEKKKRAAPKRSKAKDTDTGDAKDESPTVAAPVPTPATSVPPDMTSRYNKYDLENLKLDEYIDKFNADAAKALYEAMRTAGIVDISFLTKMSVDQLVDAKVKGLGKARAIEVIRRAKSVGGNVTFERLDVLMTKPEWAARRKHWSTGCLCLDNLLGGGIYLGDTYDFFGAGGAGKTTAAFQSLIQMFKREEDGGLVTDTFCPEAWILDTEDTLDKLIIEGKISEKVDADKISKQFVLSRLEGMAKARGVDFELVKKHVFISTARDVDAQMEQAGTAMDIATEHPDLRLILVDSLMKLFRSSEAQGMADKAKNSQKIAQFMAKLYAMKSVTGAAIICTDQAYNKLDGSASVYGPEYGEVEPGGGSVHHNLNQRVHVFAFKGGRYFKLEDSAWLPADKYRFTINETGIADFVETKKDK